MDVMLPAPRTTDVPGSTLGSRCARPAALIASMGVTGAWNRTWAENPDRRRRSQMLVGKTSATVRSPTLLTAAESMGLRPSASASRLWARVAAFIATGYGPDNHSSPAKGECSGSPFARAAAATHELAVAMAAPATSWSRCARSATESRCQASAPARSSCR